MNKWLVILFVRVSGLALHLPPRRSHRSCGFILNRKISGEEMTNSPSEILENPMDKGATDYSFAGVKESDMISDLAHTHVHTLFNNVCFCFPFLPPPFFLNMFWEPVGKISWYKVYSQNGERPIKYSRD